MTTSITEVTDGTTQFNEFVVNGVWFCRNEAPIVFDLMCEMHTQLENLKYENIVPAWKRTKLYYFIMSPFKLDRYGLIYHHLNYRPLGFCGMIDSYFHQNSNSIERVLRIHKVGRTDLSIENLRYRIYKVLASTSKRLHKVYWANSSPIYCSKYWYGNSETIIGYDPVKRLEVVDYIKTELVKQDKYKILNKKDVIDII